VPPAPLTVRRITADEHLAYVRARSGSSAISFLQVPSWAAAKAEWSHASLGWFDDEETIVGAGLVLLRQVPRVKRYLAYLPEGPDIDWTGERTGRDLEQWLTPMVAHLRAMGAFAVKMGPVAVVRRWHAETLKAAIAAGEATRLRDVEPDETFPVTIAVGDRLRQLGWSQKADTGAGFGDVQPRYVFQVPLAGRTEADLLAGFNQLWRRNIKKSEKAGVSVVTGTCDDLPAFHEVYVETAARDGFSTSRGTRAASSPPPRWYAWARTRGTPTAHRRTRAATFARRTPSSGRWSATPSPRAATSTTCAASATPSIPPTICSD
jgi:lipid II:glycine glycyltransferase (peptidoglycan interpeptide bridge formation enzyme)